LGTQRFADKTFFSTRRSFARIVLFHIVPACNCCHSVFSFSWAGHSGRLVPSPQRKYSHSFSNQPLNAEAKSTA
jgi:hypothetical protein